MIFNKQEHWLARGTGFGVKIVHWRMDGITGTRIHDKNCWNVYARIFKQHPFFANYNPRLEYSWEQPDLFPMHGGITWFKKIHDEDDSVAGYEVGCDYLHHGDEFFERCATLEQAAMVLNDAEQIFRILEAAAKGENYDE